MSKLSILIVEDEHMIVKSLKTMINSFEMNIASLFACDNINEAVAYIKENEPNIILLDIKINGGSSFDILNKVDTKDSKIIFITSHQEFAIKAFKYSAIDYLLKPINTKELQHALLKASTEIYKDEHLKINTLNFNIKNNNNKLVLSTHDELFIVDTEDIIACVSEGSYTQFFLKNIKPILVSKPIKHFDELLTSNPIFYRIHKSYLINFKQIAKVDKKNNSVVMKNDMSFPIANIRWKDFLEKATS